MAVGGVSATKTVVDREARDARSEGNSVVTVYAGDAFLPSAILTCSLPPNPPTTPVFDAVAQRQIPYDAHSLGNHEFDIGPAFTARFIKDHRINGVLNQPFLATNADFSPEPAFADLIDADGLLLPSVTDGRVVASSKLVVDDATGARYGDHRCDPAGHGIDLVARAGRRHRDRHRLACGPRADAGRSVRGSRSREDRPGQPAAGCCERPGADRSRSTASTSPLQAAVRNF